MRGGTINLVLYFMIKEENSGKILISFKFSSELFMKYKKVYGGVRRYEEKNSSSSS